MTSVIPNKLGFASRKLIHLLLNGSVGIFAFFAPAEWILPAGIGGFIIVFLFDFIRLNTSARKIVHDTMGPLFKKNESFQASGLFWAGVAALIAALYADKTIIAYAFAILAICDPAAGMLGKYTKSRRLYRSKTLNGVLLFFVTATAISMFFSLTVFSIPYPISWALVMGFILALVEMYSHPFDDNFTILLFAAVLAHVSTLIL